MERQEEPAKNTTGVSLKEHIESRLAALEKATEVAAKIMEKRLESMNEFRDALKNQANTFVTRTEVDIQVDKIKDDIKVLREYKSAVEGKASQFYVNLTLAIAILGLFISIIGLIIRI